MTAKKFWEDFKDLEEGLRLGLDANTGEKNFKLFFLYLCSLLDEYCFGLTPIIVSPEENSNQNYIFTISCSGNRDLLLNVNRLVDAAPKMQYWDVKALITGKLKTDPKLLFEPFKCDGFSITPKDIRFTVYSWDPEKNIFDLLLLIPLNLAKVDDSELENAFLILFEELWGERFVGEKINCLFFTHNANLECEFFDLEMLEACLDSFE